MRIFHFTSILLIVASLSACADKTEATESASAGIDLAQYQWKNRIILCYPKDDTMWAEQQKLIDQQREGIEDRDLVIIRVDKPLNKNDKTLQFTEAQRLAVIKKYRLSPGTSLLIGKDGGAKRKQSGKLKLKPLFELIDQMPMRREEMRSKKSE